MSDILKCCLVLPREGTARFMSMRKSRIGRVFTTSTQSLRKSVDKLFKQKPKYVRSCQASARNSHTPHSSAQYLAAKRYSVSGSLTKSEGSTYRLSARSDFENVVADHSTEGDLRPFGRLVDPLRATEVTSDRNHCLKMRWHWQPLAI